MNPSRRFFAGCLNWVSNDKSFPRRYREKWRVYRLTGVLSTWRPWFSHNACASFEALTYLEAPVEVTLGKQQRFALPQEVRQLSWHEANHNSGPARMHWQHSAARTAAQRSPSRALQPSRKPEVEERVEDFPKRFDALSDMLPSAERLRGALEALLSRARGSKPWLGSSF